MLSKRRADLQDAERCLAKERLGLIFGWSRVEAATRTAWSRAEAAIAKSDKEAAEVARDAALVEVESSRKHYDEAEANLKAFQVASRARATTP